MYRLNSRPVIPGQTISVGIDPEAEIDQLKANWGTEEWLINVSQCIDAVGIGNFSTVGYLCKPRQQQGFQADKGRQLNGVGLV